MSSKRVSSLNESTGFCSNRSTWHENNPKMRKERRRNKRILIYIFFIIFIVFTFLKYDISTYCKSFHRGIRLRIRNFRIIIPLLGVDQEKIIPRSKQTHTPDPDVFQPLLRQPVI